MRNDNTIKQRRRAGIIFLMTLAVLIMPVNTPKVHAAGKPAQVKLISVSGGCTTASASWKKVKNAAKYQVLLNGVCVAETSGLSASIRGLEGDRQYALNVRACRKNVKKVRYWYNKGTGQYQQKKPPKKLRGKSKRVKVCTYVNGKPSRTAYVQVTKCSQNISGTSEYSRMTGDTFRLDAAAKTAVTYTADRPDVAAVDAYGNVTCRGEGTATVTVTASANYMYRSASRTVRITVEKPVAEDTETVSLATPEPSVKADNYKHVSLEWESIPGADEYEVYYGKTSLELRENIEKKKPLGTTCGTRYVLYGTELSGRYHYFRVRAVKTSGSDQIFSEISERKAVWVEEAPEPETVKNGYIRLDWSDLVKEGMTISYDASEPDCDYTYHEGKWVSYKDEKPCTYNVYLNGKNVLENTAETELENHDVIDYENYDYQVYACIGDVELTDSEEVLGRHSIITYTSDDRAETNNVKKEDMPLPEAENLCVSNRTSGSIDLGWNSAESISGYRLYRDGKEIYCGDKTGYSDTGLEPNSVYTYTLKTYAGTRESNGIVGSFKTLRTEREPSGEKNSIGFEYNESCFLDYSIDGSENNAVRIVIGQVFDSRINRLLNGGKEPVSRLLTREGAYSPKGSSRACNLEIYCYDTEDLDNFLILYVAENVIVGWKTSAKCFGCIGGIELERGITKTFVKEKRLNDGNSVAFILDPGVTGGADFGGIVSGDFNAVSAVSLENEQKEELLCEYTVNALRVAIGNPKLVHNEFMYGDGRTYGSKAHAITMAESHKVTHDTDKLAVGPLAGMTYEERVGDVRQGCQKKCRTAYVLGEVACTGSGGENAACAWYSSSVHRSLILQRTCTDFAVGTCSGYWSSMLLVA